MCVEVTRDFEGGKSPFHAVELRTSMTRDRPPQLEDDLMGKGRDNKRTLVVSFQMFEASKCNHREVGHTGHLALLPFSRYP